MTSDPVTDTAIETLVEAWLEFNTMWQLNGRPDSRVCGHSKAVGFKPSKESVASADDVPRFAIREAGSSWSIKVLVTVKGTVLLPGTGAIREGTLICVLLEESRTPAVPEAAGPESVIWQELDPPPMRVIGLQATPVTETFEFAGPSSVRVCDRFWFGALMDTVVVEETAPAAAVNVALVRPVLMVIEPGIITVALEEMSGTRVDD